MRSLFIVIFLTLLFSTGGCDHRERTGTMQQTAVNALSSPEKEDGWHSLFDGRTLSGWTAVGLDSIPSAWWRVEKGTIHKVARDQVSPNPEGILPPTCDLMTVDTFLNFEFSFEWKIPPAGNSGIKYNVSEQMSTAGGSTHALGFEYQIIDDKNYPARLSPLQHTAALYDLVPPEGAEPRPAGKWNQGRIVFKGNHGEHWLNGKKVVEYELGTPLFDSLFRKSKYHKYPRFPEKRYGHIVLQDHADGVWFRNLKIKRL